MMQIRKVIFGAGDYGKRAFKVLKKSGTNTDEMVFCDNFAECLKEPLTGSSIICYEELKEIYDNRNISVIIATIHYMEIYIQCTLDGIEIEGIYDLDSNSIIEYKELCKKKQLNYCNSKWINYRYFQDDKIAQNVEKFKKGDNLSDCITEVAIMISNLCNYAVNHKRCPASLATNKEIMSIDQIKIIINELEKIEFKGTLCFHIYNEPMIDPRLFLILDYVKKKLPDVKTEIYTNGYYLNQTICDEMQNELVDILVVTGYGKQEYERILDLKLNIPFYVLYGYLDERLEKYDSHELEINEPCYSLLSQVPIYVNGDLGLCCLDYKHDSNLGNVFEGGIEEVLNKQKVHDFQMDLLSGKRSLYSLCQRCGWKRGNVK